MSRPARELRSLTTRRRLLEAQERLRVNERQRFLMRLDPQPADRIFDIGCSTGYLLTQLQALGVGEVLGCDNGDDIRPRPGILRLDAKDLRGVASEHFTKVVMSHILEHMPKADRALALQEAERILQPGGELHVALFLYTTATVNEPNIQLVSDHNEVIAPTELIEELTSVGLIVQAHDVEIMDQLSSTTVTDSGLRSMLVSATKATALQ